MDLEARMAFRQRIAFRATFYRHERTTRGAVTGVILRIGIPDEDASDEVILMKSFR